MRVLQRWLVKRMAGLRNLPTLSAMRTFRQLLTEGEPPDIETALEASSATEFLGLLSFVRVFITLGIYLRFFYHLEEYHINGWRFYLQVGLFIIFALYTVVFELIPIFRRGLVTSSTWRRVQVGLDVIFISAFYFLTYRVDSDFFLFYILPILILAQYASSREALVATLIFDLALLVTVSVLTIFKLDQSGYFVSLGDVFRRVFLGRFFALTIVGVVCAFYRRIGREYARALVEEERAKTARSSIRQRISTLLRISEYGDSRLVDELLRIVLAGVTAQDGLAFERVMLLLVDERTGGFRGKCGMGPVDKTEGKKMWEMPVEWDFDNIVDLDLRRVRFASRRLNQQLAAEVIPQEAVQFMANKVFDRNPYVRTTSDQCHQLSGVLQKFEVEEFVVVPLHSLNRFIGILIADNVVTGKGIVDSSLDDLVLFTNLAADAVENATLLREHIEEEKMLVLGKSAVGLAHEMRNPLAAMKSRVEFLSEETRDKETIDLVQGVMSDLKRLENILNWYIEYGIGTRELEFLEVSITQLLREVVDEPMMTAQISSGAIDLEVFLPGVGQEAFVRVDPQLIKRAIRNVLQNAIDAVLQSEERRIEVRLGWTDEHVEIVIRDYGPGISEKDFPQHEQVFEPFETTKRLTERSGVGLGLSIALAAVKAHGGDILVSSSAEGAQFSVVIPK